uniref:Si:ch211-14i3.2 n=1 Tax=Sphaeramia orbicularis TaxID=375764 RepID=A0A672Y8W9_9TELE
MDSLARDLIYYSEPRSESVEGSGQSVDRTLQQKFINRSAVLKKPEWANTRNHSGSGTGSDTTPAPTIPEAHDQVVDKTHASILETSGETHSSEYTVSEETFLKGGLIKADGQLHDSQTSTVNNGFLIGKYIIYAFLFNLFFFFSGGGSPKLPSQNNVFTSNTNQNLAGSGGSCLLGLSPCVVLTNFNGTSLLWDDMKRTLAFAWELHVFGSASLFILMALLAVLGLAGAFTLPHPLCEALALTNSLLVLSGTLRAVLLLLDPYGTCQILSRASLAALHNVSLQVLLWTQVILALVTLRGLKLLFFPLELRHLWVVGGLAIAHCTSLFVADLFSSVLSPSLPLLLQTLIERRAKRVTAACAFIGVLSCSLQIYSLLWLYGLLGNWRRFGWGWWLSQFCARILEVSWGFSLLVLGSWIFWTPSRACSRGDACKGEDATGLWGRILSRIRKEHLRKSEKTWEDLMPNNWAKYNLFRTGINNNVMQPYDNQPSKPEHKTDSVSSNYDSQAALLWQKVGERECVLSLIEFDMCPPSPINLRRSIDNALHHGQLVAGGLFTPPPPSWTHSVGTDKDGGVFPPAYVGYGWMEDTESIPASLDNFQTKELTQSFSGTNDQSDAANNAHQGEETKSGLTLMHAYDWSEDDVTDL